MMFFLTLINLGVMVWAIGKAFESAQKKNTSKVLVYIAVAFINLIVALL